MVTIQFFILLLILGTKLKTIYIRVNVMCHNLYIFTTCTQAYIKKGPTPIQVLPVPNAYTTFCDKTSENVSSVQLSAKCGVRIRDKKYLKYIHAPFLCKPVCTILDLMPAL